MNTFEHVIGAILTDDRIVELSLEGEYAAFAPTMHTFRGELREICRDVWNARGAADEEAVERRREELAPSGFLAIEETVAAIKEQDR